MSKRLSVLQTPSLPNDSASQVIPYFFPPEGSKFNHQKLYEHAHESEPAAICQQASRMSDSPSLVSFLSDPSTLLALGAVAVGTAWYLSGSASPAKPPLPLDNQSIEVPVSTIKIIYS